MYTVEVLFALNFLHSFDSVLCIIDKLLYFSIVYTFKTILSFQRVHRISQSIGPSDCKNLLLQNYRVNFNQKFHVTPLDEGEFKFIQIKSHTLF